MFHGRITLVAWALSFAPGCDANTPEHFDGDAPEMLADLTAGPGDLAAGPGDLTAGPGDLATGPGDLATGPGDLLALDAPLPPEVDCTGGIDDDRDGLIDCADPDCAGRTCRAATGSCDVQEICTAGVCPPDAVLAATVVCRAQSGDCDLEEKCDGVAHDCPADQLAANNTVCRPAMPGMGSASTCDVAELCDGITADCPFDLVLSLGTPCRAAAGACDAPESCDGVAPSCPTDRFQPAATECRPKAGICDLAESCTGTGPSCPADSFVPGAFTHLCRPATGVCDLAEFCPGNGPNCPGDRHAASFDECRPPAGGCDSTAENCSGGICPPDVSSCLAGQYCDGVSCQDKRPDSFLCAEDKECTHGHCVEGVCCDTACTGACKSCNLAGSAGTCSNQPNGTDPKNQCLGLTCDGAGACHTSCNGGDSCTTDCKPGFFCGGGTCFSDQGPGAYCSADCQCASGHCVDGFCCDTTCNGPCVACDLATHEGTCTSRPINTDPELGCGNYTCNGSGNCFGSCSPKGCSANCKPADYCDASNHCAPDLNQGASCSSSCDCKSGHCVDGFCCESACNGACEECKMAPGHCNAIPPGFDPDNECGNYLCAGTRSCYTGCSGICGVNECKNNSYCSIGKCNNDQGSGTPCVDSCMCANGSCDFILLVGFLCN